MSCIGAATQQAQRQAQGIADIQQQRQTEALQGLAAAQERTRGLQENRLGMKEARFQNQLQMAQGARDAAIQTIAGGIGNIGSAAIYGFDDTDFGGYNNPDPTRRGFSKKARDLRKADRLAEMEEGGKVMKTPGEFSHKGDLS